MQTQHILLADDDNDDCILFKDALEELPLSAKLTTVRNGEQLMQLLTQEEQLPNLLFLDLNMPRKSGMECLSEIKQNGKLKKLPVIIYSTSFQVDIIDLLYKNGAQHYICKPNEYTQLLKVIHLAITLTSTLHFSQPAIEDFVLSLEPCYHESK